VKESGTIFAIPTYGFLVVVFLMIGWGLLRLLIGPPPVAESAQFGITASHHAVGAAVLLLGLRAFGQRCTALTGVEAVSNGVPSFRPRKAVTNVPWHLRSSDRQERADIAELQAADAGRRITET
jgi:hypothetical protein